MSVIDNTTREHFQIPGIDHQTLASHRDGLAGLELWKQRLEPGAETPVHYHDCEEVIVVTAGSGKVIIDGKSQAFGANFTLVVPARVVHQMVNTGDGPMELIATLSASPARVFAPDGTELALPWQG